MTHRLTLRIHRFKQGGTPHFDTFQVEVPDDANVLDRSSAHGMTRTARSRSGMRATTPRAVRAACA